ncbi:MAG TPA: type III-B CRISPR module RAMP protein Cmr1 [Armatimonadetes bacterium]|nr:type III-B CRISPR module RAMP protein Cmr1 [Armatimonadota bacterium]
MREARFELETLTPLFMAGFDPRGPVEVRPPSIRGLLRFWLRALLGGAGLTDSQKLLKEENRVFGSTGEASPVIVRVEHSVDPKVKEYDVREFGGGRSGIAYIYFVARGTKKPPQPPRKYIVPPFRFSLKLSLRPAVGEEELLQLACASLWLLTRLGGIGARSRRFGGCPQVVRGDWPSSLPSFLTRASRPEQLAVEIREGLAVLFKLVNGTGGGRAPFPTLSPKGCKIWVVWPRGGIWRDWQTAVRRMGEIFRDFRAGITPRERRIELGLPIQNVQGEVVREGKVKRLSSPLLMRLARLAGPSLCAVLTWFLWIGPERGRWEVLNPERGPQLVEDLRGFLKKSGLEVKEVEPWA